VVDNLKLSICSIVKDEGEYLSEWIAYHRLIGISHFTIYDNESSDSTTRILSCLARIGVVNRIPWVTPKAGSPQLLAYSHYIEKNSDSRSFVGFFDVDEFVALPSSCLSLQGYFASHGLAREEVGAIAVNQRVFGSGGAVASGPGLVTARFTRAAPEDYPENKWCKSFFRPACVGAVRNPHVMVLRAGSYVDVLGRDLPQKEIANGQTPSICQGLRVNHYIIKSLEEFRKKQLRGGVSGATAEIRASRYNDDFFFGRDASLNQHRWNFPDIFIETLALETARIHGLTRTDETP